MVNTITVHRCEICNAGYDTYEDALECETQEAEQPLAKVGDAVDYFKKGVEGWDSSDTHLTDLVIMDIKPYKYNPHQLEYILGWATDSGEILEEFHASVESNYEFEERCKRNS